MPDIIVSYKDATIASMAASGSKKLLTKGKYCEDDIQIEYTRPREAKIYEGFVELVNEDVSDLYIPVDVSEAQYYEVIAYCDKTGTVSGDVVTYDAEPKVNAAYDATGNAFIWYACATQQNQNKSIKIGENTYSNITKPYNGNFVFAYRGNNGTYTFITNNPKSGTQIKIAGTTGRAFCKTGLYARFAYTVIMC